MKLNPYLSDEVEFHHEVISPIEDEFIPSARTDLAKKKKRHALACLFFLDRQKSRFTTEKQQNKIKKVRATKKRQIYFIISC